MAEGIEVRKGQKGRKSYRASVWSARDEKLIRKTFPTLAAAKSWRRDALVELEKGRLRPPDPQTIEEAARAAAVAEHRFHRAAVVDEDQAAGLADRCFAGIEFDVD